MAVAVGDTGLILTSEDGLTWIRQKPDITFNLEAVAYGDGMFVAAGANNEFLKSEDGVTWHVTG